MDIRKVFSPRADIHGQLQIRTFCWLGQLARQPDVTVTKRLLSAWIATPRRSGRQQATAHQTYAETLCTILSPDIMTDDLGHLRDWLSLAQSRTDQLLLTLASPVDDWWVHAYIIYYVLYVHTTRILVRTRTYVRTQFCGYSLRIIKECQVEAFPHSRTE
jgi:hypothetical protein